jgi:hypothetical protein
MWFSGPNAVVLDRRTQHVFVPVGGRGSVSMRDAHPGRLLCTLLMLLLPLQRLTPLVLLSPTIRREAPRLVHRQNRGHEQHQQGDTGVEQRGWAPQLADIGPGRCRPCGYASAKAQHEHQQADIAEDVNQEFRQDPIVPEQAPLGAQCLDEPREQRGEAQGEQDEPPNPVHPEIGGTPDLGILPGQADDGESEEASDGAEPADRGADMRCERDLAEARGPGHGRYTSGTMRSDT